MADQSSQVFVELEQLRQTVSRALARMDALERPMQRLSAVERRVAEAEERVQVAVAAGDTLIAELGALRTEMIGLVADIRSEEPTLVGTGAPLPLSTEPEPEAPAELAEGPPSTERLGSLSPAEGAD